MKTITEIQNKVAQEKGYDDWFDAMYSIPLIADQRLLVDEAMLQHASQMCAEQIKACAENAQDKAFSSYEGEIIVELDSILNTPNVVTTK